jgi:hypothetical protein
MFGWPSPKPLTASQCWERAFGWLAKASETEEPIMRKMLTGLADDWAFLAENREREEKRLRFRRHPRSNEKPPGQWQTVLLRQQRL